MWFACVYFGTGFNVLSAYVGLTSFLNGTIATDLNCREYSCNAMSLATKTCQLLLV